MGFEVARERNGANLKILLTSGPRNGLRGTPTSNIFEYTLSDTTPTGLNPIIPFSTSMIGKSLLGALDDSPLIRRDATVR